MENKFWNKSLATNRINGEFSKIKSCPSGFSLVSFEVGGKSAGIDVDLGTVVESQILYEPSGPWSGRLSPVSVVLSE